MGSARPKHGARLGETGVTVEELWSEVLGPLLAPNPEIPPTSRLNWQEIVYIAMYLSYDIAYLSLETSRNILIVMNCYLPWHNQYDAT